MNIPLTRIVPANWSFAEDLAGWLEAIAPLTLEKLLRDAGDPRRVAVFCVDTVNGFCTEGQFESSRARAIIRPIVGLLERAHEAGVRTFVATYDEHPADAVEFRDFPVHCVRGTSETHIVPELAALPFFGTFSLLPKLAVCPAAGSGLEEWLTAHPDVTHRVVVGVFTDLAVYQLAMYLKQRANAANATLPVVIPANCVDTYDVPLEVARGLGIPPHPADFHQRTFLHHLALNGIQVVRSID